MAKRDPRKSIKYKRMIDIIEVIRITGPCTIDDICTDLGLEYREFRHARYSLPGELAMQDSDVCMPRPVASEGYVYKLAETYKSGDADTDGAPNFQKAISDIVTRQATVYSSIDALLDLIPAGTKVRRAVIKMRRASGAALDQAENMASEANAPISERAQYVIDNVI